MNFKNRVVLITGATGGLGEAVTAAFLKAGATVAVTYTNKAKFDELQSRLSSAAGKLSGVEANLLEGSSVQNAIEQVVKQHKGINALVNLVGGYLGGVSIAETGEEQWDKMMNLNLKSAFLTCKSALPVMVENKGGRIVNISSQGGLKGGEGIAAYGASKAGLINFTQSLAAEGRAHNITANVIVPGIIDTPANRQAMPKEDFSQWTTPEAIGGVILFLTSEEAGNVSGAVIPVS